MKKTTPTQAFLATIKNNFLKTLTGKLREKYPVYPYFLPSEAE